MSPPRRDAGGGGHWVKKAGNAFLVLLVLAAVVTLFYSASSLQHGRAARDWTARETELKLQMQDLLAEKEKLLTQERKKAESVGAVRKVAETERDELKQKYEALNSKVAALIKERDTAAAEAAKARKAWESAASERATLSKQSDAAVKAHEAALSKIESLKREAVTLKTRLGKDDKAAACTAVDRHLPWEPSKERDILDPSLAAILRKVAIRNEVIVAMSNRNYANPGGMLDVWTQNIKRAGVKNALVICLDDDTLDSIKDRGVAGHRMDMQVSEAQKETGENHAVSSLKFRVLRQFMQLGYSVLLSDVDIVFLQNPFEHLYRDSDVESMSDGWDNGTAYGYNDVFDDARMGWARYAHSMRVFVFNSGLFYIRPTQATMDLLDMIVYRVDTTNGWDQAIFNEAIFFPSSLDHKDPSITRRVMDYMLFMNSKVLFTQVRHDASLQKHKPVSIHVNYHPDKFPRMLAIVDRYVKGNLKALEPFPDGSE